MELGQWPISAGGEFSISNQRRSWGFQASDAAEVPEDQSFLKCFGKNRLNVRAFPS